jgi:hypothetical protein
MECFCSVVDLVDDLEKGTHADGGKVALDGDAVEDAL